MGPKEIYFERNLKNMMNYVRLEGLEEFVKALRACKSEDEAKAVIDSRKEDFEKARQQIQKWSDLDKFTISVPDSTVAAPAEN
jgi:hypothetical protein